MAEPSSRGNQMIVAVLRERRGIVTVDRAWWPNPTKVGWTASSRCLAWDQGLQMGEDGRVVCVVDDDASLRRSLRNLLTSVGFRVETFQSAEAFLGSVHRQNTGCVVLDLRMAGMSGLDLLRHLAATDSRIPVVILTAHGDDETRRAIPRRPARSRSSRSPSSAPPFSTRYARRCPWRDGRDQHSSRRPVRTAITECAQPLGRDRSDCGSSSTRTPSTTNQRGMGERQRSRWRTQPRLRDVR